jgi:hypothetical protein
MAADDTLLSLPAVRAIALALMIAVPAATPAQSGRGRFVWSDGSDRIEISYDGEVEFTEDDTDVKAVAPGGYFKISTGNWFGRGVEVRSDASGTLIRRYRVGIVEKPYEPEGRLWLARTLPRFIRRSGIGAPARVARILKARGPSGVLAEISQIEGSYGKRVYFTELFRTGSLDAAITRRALSQASREVTSDYELASLLVASQDLVSDDASRQAYFDAASTIQSDYELQRVLSAGLKAGPVAPLVLASILTSASSIESDYELASLLVRIARLQRLDGTTRRPFFDAFEGVGSAYERGRVLSALMSRGDLSPDVLAAMLQSAARVRSDYEQAQFLTQIGKAYTLDTVLRPPFFAAADAIRSSFEKGRVLEAVARRPGAPPETILSVLRSASTIDGSHERSQVLLAVAANHPISGAAREAYIEAAEKLGEYEQQRVLSALVRRSR